jgi:hypothetical protein
MFCEPDNGSRTKGQPTGLTHIRGALWRPESLPCSLPDGDGISHHESIPEKSTCSGKVDDVLGSEMRENLMNLINGERGRDRMTFFIPQKGCPEAWQGAG